MNNEGRLGQPSLASAVIPLEQTPRAVADFDATQFFPRFYIDNGDVV